MPKPSIVPTVAPKRRPLHHRLLTLAMSYDLPGVPPNLLQRAGTPAVSPRLREWWMPLERRATARTVVFSAGATDPDCADAVALTAIENIRSSVSSVSSVVESSILQRALSHRGVGTAGRRGDPIAGSLELLLASREQFDGSLESGADARPNGRAPTRPQTPGGWRRGTRETVWRQRGRGSG